MKEKEIEKMLASLGISTEQRKRGNKWEVVFTNLKGNKCYLVSNSDNLKDNIEELFKLPCEWEDVPVMPIYNLADIHSDLYELINNQAEAVKNVFGKKNLKLLFTE